jgi:hypothetical protein
MSVLTDDQKTFIVQRLACYDSPQVVADAFKEEFGEPIARAKVYNYDPTRSGFDQAEKWREIFDATRKLFLESATEAGIAHKSVRLRRLEDMCQRAMGMRNFALAAQLMEQAAREVGNAFTNRRELTGKDGSAVSVDATVIYALPDNGRE